MPTDLPASTGAPLDFEIVDHTADWAIRVYGIDLAHLLQNAARGMAPLLVEDLDAVPTNVERRLTLETIDAETLLVDWLGEMAYWAESEQLVFIQYEISEVSATHLKAIVIGGRAPVLLKHIKAVTYHELNIVEIKTGLTATVVFDV